ncbi:DUF6429 family protein [Longimicrobium sp.]|uniref:DUF6429 family protein n=1 Tax=Longimicrobium sp. TaxID=2029185 RepID=UPI0032C23A62
MERVLLDLLALLHEQGLIFDPRGRARSVVLTEKGLARSRGMYERHLEPPQVISPGGDACGQS